MEKLRLKRHGSFSIREGWFEKAINSIKENEKSVFSKENGVAILGIGANMVTSLHYWLIASDIITEKNSVFKDFGKLLVEYDPYLESEFSWWMIHQHLVENYKNAPIFNIVFNEFHVKNFNKEILNQFVINYMKENDIDLSNSAQVDADTSVLLRTYINERVDNPEDNLNSPLGKLGLLHRSTDGTYNFSHPNYEDLDYLPVYYSLLKCIEGDSANIDDLMQKKNSPAHIFNLDKNMFYIYINDMGHAGLITMNPTAGLNMIYVQKRLSEKEIFKDFFGRDE